MIYDYLFSANNRQPGTIARQQAATVDIGTLLFNFHNPGFAFLLKVMKKINKTIS